MAHVPGLTHYYWLIQEEPLQQKVPPSQDVSSVPIQVQSTPPVAMIQKPTIINFTQYLPPSSSPSFSTSSSDAYVKEGDVMAETPASAFALVSSLSPSEAMKFYQEFLVCTSTYPPY